MKILLTLFSIYILGLYFVPCSDSVVNVDESHEKVVVAMDHSQGSSHQNQADQCPPFCQCHCCHVHVTDFNAVGFKPITFPISTELFNPVDSFDEEHPSPLLDPPRV